MKKYILSVFVAIGASLLAPQTAKAQSLSDNGNGYEVEMVYNRGNKTTTIILYKDCVEVGRVTSHSN